MDIAMIYLLLEHKQKDLRLDKQVILRQHQIGDPLQIDPEEVLAFMVDNHIGEKQVLEEDLDILVIQI